MRLSHDRVARLSNPINRQKKPGLGFLQGRYIPKLSDIEDML
jgi:hypothetical protein